MAWLEWDGQQWTPRRAKVMAEDLTRIEGQNYEAVPRVTLAEMLRDQHRRREQRARRPHDEGPHSGGPLDT